MNIYSKKFNKNIYKNDKLKFKGYKRVNGSAGVRNKLWIVPTVGCVNRIIERFKKEVKPEGINYIGVFKHNNGCSQMGEDLASTRNILIDMVKHPNAGGVLVFGLGCEYNNMKEFKNYLGKYDKNRVRFMVAQEVSD